MLLQLWWLVYHSHRNSGNQCSTSDRETGQGTAGFGKALDQPSCFHFSVYLSLTHISCCPKYVEYLLSVISDDSSATPGFAWPKILATQWPLVFVATQNGCPLIAQSASNF